MIESLLRTISSQAPLTYTEVVCPSCGANGLSIFYEVRNVPVHCTSIMLTREEAEKSARGDIVLGYCGKCGFISNVAFDPSIQNSTYMYEDQQSFSPTFEGYARELADYLIKKYHVYGKNIIEIGCGKGDFLVLLCKVGNNRGVGIDPISVKLRPEGEVADDVIWIQDYYSEKHGEYDSDLIICRHTLEHIYFTGEFVRTVRRAIRNRLKTVVVFEVPDISRIMHKVAFWDIYYEHSAYFSPGSLARLFRRCGFELIEMKRVYDGQYLLLEAKPISRVSEKVLKIEESIESMTSEVEDFFFRVRNMLKLWGQRLREFHAQRKRVAIWGSGSKCVGFLTTVGKHEEIGYVVDINPYRQGKFIPGVGKEIMSPMVLKEWEPDVVIVMNPVYCAEIKKMLNDMGVNTEIILV